MIGLGLNLGPGAGGGGGGSHLKVLEVGQSDLIARPTFDSGATHPDNVFQWGREAPNNGVLIDASIPLEHIGATAGDMGPDIDFSISWAAQAGASDTLTFIPANQGGTDTGTDWNESTGTNYLDAVSRASACIADSETTETAIWWDQGQADVGSTAGYQSRVIAILEGFRADVTGFSATTPIIVAEPGPDWVSNNGANGAAILAAIQDLPNHIANCAVVSKAGTSTFDGTHTNAAGQRIVGPRAWDALLIARQANAGLPQAPVNLVATPGNTEVDLTWDAYPNGEEITDFVVEYSTDNENWSTFSDGVSTAQSATVTGLTNDTLYYFRVSTVNGTGTGSPSGAATATPVVPTAVTRVAFDSFSSTANLTTYSFAGKTVGTGSVVIAISHRGGSSPSVTAVRVGGVAASVEFASSTVQGGAVAVLSGVSAGTVTIEVDISAAPDRLGGHIWTLADGDVSGVTTAFSPSTDNVSIDVSENGFLAAVGATSNSGSSPEITWTGVNEREAWANYGDNFGTGAGDLEVTADETGRTVDSAGTGGFNSVIAAFVPAA
jgi:hypothetical protein